MYTTFPKAVLNYRYSKSRIESVKVPLFYHFISLSLIGEIIEPLALISTNESSLSPGSGNQSALTRDRKLNA